MAVPEFILELRRHVGHAPLWLSGVTAIVLDASRQRTIAIRRSDTGQWTPVTGIIDPGEQPAHAAVREVAEEAGVTARPVRLIDVGTSGPIVHANGDQADYLTLCFILEHVEGEPHSADDETTEARWFPLEDLPPMPERFARLVRLAATDPRETAFLA